MNRLVPRTNLPLSSRVKRLLRREVVPVAAVVFVLLAFRSAVADWYDVPTGSMRPTILEGDRILVNKLAYDLRTPFFGWRLASWDDPVPGEIVIFPSPKDGTRLVKRVIAGPGDTVELRDNVLIVNGIAARWSAMDPSRLSDVPFGERVGREFVTEQMPGIRAHAVTLTPGAPAPKSFAPVRVPAAHYLVMGDNRDQSADSRVFGFVPRESIVGRSSRVALSLDRARWLLPRWSRFGRRL
jgi:signal peptidase I